MKSAKPENCPDQTTLLQYIQGLLEPPTLGRCEEHVTDCPSCHETLQGLNVGDTLSQHVSDAIKQSPTDSPSDSQAIDGLIQRLLKPENLHRKFPGNRNAPAEVMADKAAEVLRCIEPATDSEEECLGALGDYRLLKLIGAGGTGVVFQAKDTSLDRIVALKVLRPSLGEIARERFIAEARLAASIEHDNVVTIYQIGQHDRLAFIAMQWTSGETLEARLEREPAPLDQATVREFVSQIASGLAAAHQRQLIHRDIKPANIWICDDTGRIKILDFGLARVADEESSLTQTGMLAGTPSFMSPEQTKGMELDPRSDLFSLGCVMYKLLTGRLPFSATTVLGTLQTIQSDSPQSPSVINPNCDADLSDLTMSLLEKLPGNRLASAENLIACLNSKRESWPLVVPQATSVSNVDHDEPTKTLAKPKPESKSSRGPGNWITAITLLGLFAVPGWLFAPQIYRIATNQGELIIETSDENVKVQVLRNGEEVKVLDSTTGNSLEITAGEYTFNATNGDSDSEFTISPNSVVLNRGGKEIVSVEVIPSTKIAEKDAESSPGKVVTDALPDATAFYSQLMEERNRIKKGYGKVETPEERWAMMEATIAAFEAQKLQFSEKLGPGHPTTKSFDSQIAAMKRIAALENTTEFDQVLLLEAERQRLLSQYSATHPKVARIEQKLAKLKKELHTPAPTPTPIYRGRSFDQWLSIAENDREPKTVADAIAACATLADENQKDEFLALLRKLMRTHGVAHCTPTNSGNNYGGAITPSRILFTGLAGALSQLESKEIVDLIQSEIESGNERSLGCCSCITDHIDFDGEYQKRKELYDQLHFDISPMLQRIKDGKLKFNSNVQAFLEFTVTNRHEKTDFNLAADAIRTLDVGERPMLYSMLMRSFDKGEFDEMIEADFFAKSTNGEARSQFFNYLPIATLGSGYGGGRFGGGGGGIINMNYSPSSLELVNRLLVRSIKLNIDTEESGLDFKPWAEFSYNDDGQIQTSNGSNGMMYLQGDGTYTTAKPDLFFTAQGRVAIVRNLLSQLCQNAIWQQEAKDRDTLVAFAKEFLRESKLEGIAPVNLKIDHDLQTLLKLANGENVAYDDFSNFVKTKNQGFGSRGGGGVF